jgi:hypothetical protein
MDDFESSEEYVEWRVETEQTEDDFGTDESGARSWFANCKDDPEWAPVVLLRRTVVIYTSEWEKV